MMSTTSSVIEWCDPKALKAHPLNQSIYGDDQVTDLAESIATLGVLEPLYVKTDNTVLSGHRRWRACLTLEQPPSTVPVIRVDYANALDEAESIIEHNRYRQKNGCQLLNEGRRLEVNHGERAKQQQMEAGQEFGRGQEKKVVETLPQAIAPKTRDKVAQAIGLGSGKQWDKLKDIGEKASQGDPEAKAVLPKIHQGVSLNAAHQRVKQREARAEQVRQIVETEPPASRYHVIVIDPPWQYNKRPDDVTHRGKVPYLPMTISELESFQIPAAEDSILWLWTTNAFIHEALLLIKTWGFEYKTMLTWVKDRMGTGDWLRGQTEHCLLAVKGNYRISPGNATTVLLAPRSTHSAKPDEFYALVERLCPGTRIDLFARRSRDGWAVWGCEVDHGER